MTSERVRVGEEAYGVVARIEGEYRSDRVMGAMRLHQRLRAKGRDSEVVEEEDGAVSVRVHLGDAPESDFEEAAGEILEAASW